jgi:hypothetical protein
MQVSRPTLVLNLIGQRNLYSEKKKLKSFILNQVEKDEWKAS